MPTSPTSSHEEENTVASDRAFMLRRAAISTATGKRGLRLITSAASTKRESEIRQTGYAKTNGVLNSAMEEDGGGAEAADNMVAAMKRAVDVDGVSKLTPQEVRDEFITIQGAGHETTSNTLSWVFMLLAQNPEAQRRVQAEVDAVCGVGGDRTATFEQASELSYCE